LRDGCASAIGAFAQHRSLLFGDANSEHAVFARPLLREFPINSTSSKSVDAFGLAIYGFSRRHAANLHPLRSLYKNILLYL
jgi:hypothetical protein